MAVTLSRGAGLGCNEFARKVLPDWHVFVGVGRILHRSRSEHSGNWREILKVPFVTHSEIPNPCNTCILLRVFEPQNHTLNFKPETLSPKPPSCLNSRNYFLLVTASVQCCIAQVVRVQSQQEPICTHRLGAILYDAPNLMLHF